MLSECSGSAATKFIGPLGEFAFDTVLLHLSLVIIRQSTPRLSSSTGATTPARLDANAIPFVRNGVFGSCWATRRSSCSVSACLAALACPAMFVACR